MIGKEVLSSKPVPLTTVKEILKERSEKSEKTELNYEQKLSFEYAKKFAKLTPSKQEKFLEELAGLPSIDAGLALKIVDMLPQEKEVLQLLAQKTKATEEDLEKVATLVKKYA